MRVWKDSSKKRNNTSWNKRLIKNKKLSRKKRTNFVKFTELWKRTHIWRKRRSKIGLKKHLALKINCNKKNLMTISNIKNVWKKSRNKITIEKQYWSETLTYWMRRRARLCGDWRKLTLEAALIRADREAILWWAMGREATGADTDNYYQFLF